MLNHHVSQALLTVDETGFRKQIIAESEPSVSSRFSLLVQVLFTMLLLVKCKFFAQNHLIFYGAVNKSVVPIVYTYMTCNSLFSEAMHCFEIRTANIDYFIGEDPQHGQKDAGKIQMPSPESGIGAHLAKTWENAIRLHCMAEIMKGKYSCIVDVLILMFHWNM